MGSSFSKCPRPSPDFAYFALGFRYPDKIKMVLAQEEVVQSVTQSVALHWRIQEQGYEQGGSCYKIKFSGMPFGTSTDRGNGDTNKKAMLRHIDRSDLYAIGWQLVVSSDLTHGDLSTLFFRKFSVDVKKPSIICLSISHYHSLQLINAPRHLWRSFVDAVQFFAGGLKDQRIFDENLEIKLPGTPWHTYSLNEGIRARKVLLAVFRVFDLAKYHFYGTANLKGTADCIFFIHDERQPCGLYQYSMLSLNKSGRLCLIDCPESTTDAVRNSIDKYLIIHDETNIEHGWEFKFKGHPSWADGGETVAARFLITMILQKLLSVGWSILTSLDISRRLNDKGVFILRSSRPIAVPHFCISLNETDKIRLINIPDNMKAVIRDTVVTYWSLGIGRERDFYSSHEFKLNGSPWGGCRGSSDSLAAKCLMCIILAKLEKNGWYLVCSADVSAKYNHSDNLPDYPLDVHSWFIAQRSSIPVPETFANADAPGTSTSVIIDSEPSDTTTTQNGLHHMPSNGLLPSYPNEPPPPSYDELYGK